jgi:hypothetical protein
MGCSSCGGARTAAAGTYPKEAVMPDGTKVTVTSAADERTQRARFHAQERDKARVSGYTVRR